MKKKMVSMALTLALGMSMFTGVNTVALAEESKEPVTLEFWTIALQPTFTDYINGVIEKFEDQYDWITIDWIDLPYDAYEQKLISTVAGGNAPDVVNVPTTAVFGKATSESLVNMYEEATEEQLSIYSQARLEANNIEGGLYGLPWYISIPTTMYNTEIFAEAGYDAPPKTFDEMLDMAQTVKEKTGAYIYVPSNLYSEIYCQGIPFLSDDLKTAAFNTPELLDMLTRLQEAVQNDWLPRTNWGDWDAMMKMYCTGKLAMMCTTQAVGRVEDEAPDIAAISDIAEAMVGNGNFVMSNSQYLVVPKASEHHEESILFANFVTNDENVLEFCKLATIFPGTIKAVDDPYFTSDTETLAGKARAAAAAVAKESHDYGIGILNAAEVNDVLNDLYGSVMQSGKDPQEMIDEAEEEVNEILARED